MLWCFGDFGLRLQQHQEIPAKCRLGQGGHGGTKETYLFDRCFTKNNRSPYRSPATCGAWEVGDREDPTENPFDKAVDFFRRFFSADFSQKSIFSGQSRAAASESPAEDAWGHNDNDAPKKAFNLKDSREICRQKLKVRNQVEAAGGQNLPLWKVRGEMLAIYFCVEQANFEQVCQTCPIASCRLSPNIVAPGWWIISHAYWFCIPLETSQTAIRFTENNLCCQNVWTCRVTCFSWIPSLSPDLQWL